jgi:hypothetical protein
MRSQDVVTAKNSLSLAGAALSLQRSAAYALQGQLNSSMAATAAATSVEDEARAKVQAAEDAVAALVKVELEKKSLLDQITDLGNKTRASGDKDKQMVLIDEAIIEAKADFEMASRRVADAEALKAVAEAGLRKVALVQDFAEAKMGGIKMILNLALNETDALQVYGRQMSLGAQGAARGR